MKRLRPVLFAAGAVAVLALALVLAFLVVVRSAWFERQVRNRIVAEVERVTGGRAEIGVFRFNWQTLTAEVSPFVLHGTEPAGAPPLFRADLVRVGLKIISMLRRRVDIESLAIARPDLRILVTPDGRTNFPHPRIPHRGRPFVDELLRLAIRHMDLDHGFLEYNSVRIPLDLQGEQLEAVLRYDQAGPRYTGDLSFTRMRLNARAVHNLTFGVSTGFSIQSDGLHVPHGRVTMPDSDFTFSGAMLNWPSPRGDFAVNGEVAVADAAPALAIRVVDRGRIAFTGRALFDVTGLRVTGAARGRGLDFRTRPFSFRDATLAGNLYVDKSILRLTDLTISALGGQFHGTASIRDWRSFQAAGDVARLTVAEISRARGQPITAWNGTLAGPASASGVFNVSGVRDVVANGALALAPIGSGPPLSGVLHVQYDQRPDQLQLSDSDLKIGTSELKLAGILGRELAVRLSSGNLNDVLPLFTIVGFQPPRALPVQLAPGGSAMVRASIKGPLENPVVTGHAEGGPLRFDDRTADHAAGDFSLTRNSLGLTNTTVRRGGMSLAASGQLGLEDWRASDASAVNATLTLRGGDLAQLASDLGRRLPIGGAVSGTAAVRGTLGAPATAAMLQGTAVTAWHERFDRIQANMQLHGATLQVSELRAQAGKGSIVASGTYQHASHDWTSGTLRATVASRDLRLASVESLQQLRPGTDGDVDLNATSDLRLAHGSIASINALDGNLALRNASVDHTPLGSGFIEAKTTGAVLTATISADIRNSQVRGSGQWRLRDSSPGQGRLTFTPISFRNIRDLASLAGQPLPDLPFTGSVSGTAAVSGPLRDIRAMRAEVRLDHVFIAPGPNTQLQAVTAADLTVSNPAPILFDVDSTGMTIRSARFAARDTTIEADGRIGFAQNRWEVNAAGNINLAILQLLGSDIIAGGQSDVSVRLRGPLRAPRVTGRLELRRASLHLSNVPNGVENANGVINFDTDRATIERLTAESGGGHVALTGFVGFGGPFLTYRLGAQANGVRYRSPEGASITADADLTMAGTSQSSVISGTVTITRAAFNPRTDLGTLLAQAARPVSTPVAPTERFSGIRLDIHVESSQTLEIESTLARNIEAEVNLRVRGTPDRPAVLGDLTVSQGQIDFFGTRYLINRGEVSFFNPVHIEPVIDLDLQTRVRGVTVNLTFSGPMNRLNISYRSDPPLKSDQIIALLAVGRSPNEPGFLGATQSTTGGGLAGSGGNLLEEALTAPVTGRLQRFFGVSHIRIDPQLTDITSVPQARITVEQQISQDVILTYITNLARTSEQIIRLEWDLNRRWSVVAVREDTGEFGIDFQWRRQFK